MIIDIAEVRKFIATCPFLEDFAPVHVNWTDDNATNYGIGDVGETTLFKDVIGRKKKQHNYYLYSRQFTPVDEDRILATNFNQNFQNWIEQQNENKNFPVPPADSRIDKMWATNGMLMSIDPTGTKGLYQIQFYIVYWQN